MATPIVNITPRSLPRAVPSDLAGGVQRAASTFFGITEQRRAQEQRAAEIEAEQGFRREMVGLEADEARKLAALRGEIEGDLVGQRGQVEEGLIQTRGNVEGNLVDLRGQVQDRSGEIEFDRESGVRERQFGQRDRELDLRARGLDAELEIARMRDRTDRAGIAARSAGTGGGGGVRLEGLARDLIDPVTEGERPTARQIQGLIGVARGDTAAARLLNDGAVGPVGGEESGARLRTPPGGEQIELPQGINVTQDEINELASLPVSSHVETLRLLSESQQAEYVSLLPPDIAQQVLGALR